LVFWRWAAAIERRQAPALREVAARLDQMQCPYEAALALRDAGDLAEAYRRLRILETTTARMRAAEELRAAGQRIPRRTRAALDRDNLTDAERRICVLVAEGATNEAVATALGISPRTVSSHLTRIYEKARPRPALAAWWRRREPLSP
jgi:DNA-binding CsgD family transcriptional regulator